MREDKLTTDYLRERFTRLNIDVLGPSMKWIKQEGLCVIPFGRYVNDIPNDVLNNLLAYFRSRKTDLLFLISGDLVPSQIYRISIGNESSDMEIRTLIAEYSYMDNLISSAELNDLIYLHYEGYGLCIGSEDFVTTIFPEGIRAAQKAFIDEIEELRREGYSDPERLDPIRDRYII